MKKYMFILAIIIILSAILSFLPHVNYSLRLHVDEYVHFQYASNLTEDSPLYFTGNSTSLERGFHLELATLKSLGVPYLFQFSFFPAILTAILSLSIFIVTRRIFNTTSAIFASLFIALLKSSVEILGPAFLVPMSIGLILITLGLFLLELSSSLFFIPLASLLIIHPPSALAYFLIININLAIKRTNIKKTIILQAFAFLLALPLYLTRFIEQRLSTIDNLSFTIISSPLFIPRLIGYISILIIALGIYSSLIKKRYDLTIYTLTFIFFIMLFYFYKIELFLPYRRSLMYLFIILSILFGLGCSKIINSSKNKKIVFAIMLILLLAIYLPPKIQSSDYFYHIAEESDYDSLIYIRENTPSSSIVLAEPWFSNAITPISQRQVYSRIIQGKNKEMQIKNNLAINFFMDECRNTQFLKENNLSIIYGNCSNSDLKEIHQNVYLFQSAVTNSTIQ